jgi:hypothetical protein
LHGPVSVLHPCAVFKWFLYTLIILARAGFSLCDIILYCMYISACTILHMTLYMHNIILSMCACMCMLARQFTNHDAYVLCRKLPRIILNGTRLETTVR